MSRHHCLRVLVGGPPERRLLDILDRFSSAGWVVIYARKPDQAREIVEAQLADVALLHPGMGGAMPSGSKLPLVLLGSDPLSVLERKVQAASSTGAGDRLSALRYARTATPTPGVTPATPAQARGGFTGSGRVIPPNAPGTAERRGELRTTPLAVLLLDAAFERCTGVLSLRVGEIQRELAIQDGEVVAAASNIPAERLGAQLVRQGLLTNTDRSTVQQAVEREPRVPVGQHLLRAKLLSPEQLERALAQQVERRVSQALLLQDGAFGWTPLRSVPPERRVNGPKLLELVAGQVLQEFGESTVSSLLAADAGRVVRRSTLFTLRNAILRGRDDARRLAERIDNQTRLSALLEPATILHDLRVILLLYLARAIGFSADPERADLPEEQLPWGPTLGTWHEPEVAPSSADAAAGEAAPAEVAEPLPSLLETTPVAPDELLTTSPAGEGEPAGGGDPLAAAAFASESLRPGADSRPGGMRPVDHRGARAHHRPGGPAPVDHRAGAPRVVDPRLLGLRTVAPRPAEGRSLTPRAGLEASPPPVATSPEAEAAAPEQVLEAPPETASAPTGSAPAAAGKPEKPKSKLFGALRNLPIPPTLKDRLPTGQAAPDGDLDEPTPLFPEGPLPGSDKAQALVTEARAFLKAGKLKDAAELFEQAWNAEPNYADGISMSGWCKFQSNPNNDKCRKEGLEDMQMAVSLAADDEGLPFLRLGLALKELGKLEQSVIQFKAAIKLDPHLQEARLALADVEVELQAAQGEGGEGGGEEGGGEDGKPAAKLKGWLNKGLSKVKGD
ncbi:MAG: hypothetical protein RBU45_08690 [Myxococcota bacterium]|nr:hypothetical protein [Myxococcota bacterium]